MIATIPLYDAQIETAINTPSFYEVSAHVPAKLVSFDQLQDLTFHSDPSLAYRNIALAYDHRAEIAAVKSSIFEDLIFPDRWLSEGIASPNLASKKKSFEICQFIFFQRKIFPSKIASTKEEGIYLSYIADNKSLIIEVYNNLEVAAIVTNNEKK